MGRPAPGRTYRDPRIELVEVWRSILYGRCRVIERFGARGRRYFVVVVCQPGETHPQVVNGRIERPLTGAAWIYRTAGVDIAAEAARLHRFHHVQNADDIEERYSVSQIID